MMLRLTSQDILCCPSYKKGKMTIIKELSNQFLNSSWPKLKLRFKIRSQLEWYRTAISKLIRFLKFRPSKKLSHLFDFENLIQWFKDVDFWYGTTLAILKNLFLKLLILRIKNFVVPKNIIKNPCLAHLFQKDGL